MSQLTFQDAHLHLQDVRFAGDLEQIIDTTRKAGVNRMVVNGTCPEDWDKVTELHQQHSDLIIPSYGLHPWKTPAKDDSWKQELVRLIESNPIACIGECGLDRWMQNPDIESQEDAFRFQLELATRLNKPISIHVLKAWGWFLDILQSSEIPARGFMLHSYGGSKEIALQLAKLGAYFSFSGYFLQQRKANVREAFKAIPRDQILIETDAPDMLPPAELISHPLEENLNHPANLPTIAQGLAKALESETKRLAPQLQKNFEEFFAM